MAELVPRVTCTCGRNVLNETENMDETTYLLNSTGGLRRSTLERIWLALFLFILILGTGIGTYLLLREGNQWSAERLELVTRQTWNATNSTPKLLNHPIRKILLLPTNTSDCNTKDQCLQYLEAQNDGDLNFGDLYNFFVAGDGRIYEGRGWNYRSDVSSGNVLTLALVGKFDEGAPTNKQLNGIKAFLDYTIMNNILDPCYEVLVKHFSRRYFVDVALKIQETVRKERKCFY